MDVSALFDAAALTALVEILAIDIVLAGDNAIVVGALAAGLQAEQRRKVIMIGVAAALVLRIAFALVVTQLLQIVGLVLAGGFLLLWVAWKVWRELRHEGEPAETHGPPGRGPPGAEARQELRQRCLGGRSRRLLDEPRQCAGGGRSGARPSLGAGIR